MAAYDLEEQEQISEIKAFWEKYGKLITGLAVAAAVASVSWQGWQWYQRKQASEAAMLYAVVQRAAAEHNPQKVREAAGQILEKYNGTAYADLAALTSGKAQAEAGDLKNARAHLGWAAEHANDPALRDLARLRLAAVLLDDKAYDEALKQLSTAPSSEAFAPRFDDLRGDVLMAQNKPAEAKAAYKAAGDKLAASSQEGAAGLKELIQAKLESLGGAQ